MATLIASLSTGKGTWMKVIEILKLQNWENIFLITNDFGKEKFQTDKNVEFIVINDRNDAKSMTQDIKNKLSGKINDFEVAVNIDSGTGKEHMAIVSSLIGLGISIRFVTAENNQLIEITPNEN